MLDPTVHITPQPKYIGFVEGYEDGKYWGWALDTQSPAPLYIDVFLDDLKLTSIRTRIARYDLLSSWGKVTVGFDFHLDPHKVLGLRLFHGHAIFFRFPDGSDLIRLEGVPDQVSIDGGKIHDLREVLQHGFRFSTKHGALIRPFSSNAALVPEKTARFARFLQHASAKLGVDLCIAYGTLLGAVRDRTVIPHDDDFDTFAIVQADSLADLIAWQMELLLRMKRLGEPLHQSPASAPSLVYQFEGEFFDIFVAWLRPDGYLCSYHLDMRCGAADIFPFKTVELGGEQVPAPNNASDILSNTYGEAWRIPDPEFQWTPPESSIIIANLWLQRLKSALNTLGADPYLDPTRPGLRVKWTLSDSGVHQS